MVNLNQSSFDLDGGRTPVWKTEMFGTHPVKAFQSISGKYLSDYTPRSEERVLLRHIDQAEWLTDLKRRVQHYGYRYDYRARKIAKDMRIGDLPEWVAPLAQRIGNDFFNGRRPDQMIVNEYQPGQGIAPHVDCAPCFGPVVVSISLGSTCVMDIAKQVNSAEKTSHIADSNSDQIRLFLKSRSAVVLAGDSRYHWTHAIAPRKTDTIDGHAYPRGRRVSLTFRTVIL